jgi:hypothetical protein
MGTAGDDVEVDTACRRMLKAAPAVRSFTSMVYRTRLEEKVDGTGKRAVVVQRNNGWTQPQDRTTQEYPLLMIKIWADHSRDESGAYAKADNVDNAYAVYRVIDPLMHGQRGAVWGGENGLTIVTCTRWAEPYVITQEDTHGMPKDEIGDCAIVVVQYALQVVHSTAA